MTVPMCPQVRPYTPPCLAVWFVVVVLSVGPLSAQTNTSPVQIYARLEPGNLVQLVDSSTGRSKTVYASPKWATRDLTVSPDGRRLALLEIDAGIVEGVNYRIPPRSELVILDASGTLLHRVARDVQRYVWCGTSCLAGILGTEDETDLGFRPIGAFVLDLATGDSSPLPGPPYPSQLTWAAFDSSVYLRYSGPRIVRYHLATRSLHETTHRDLHFSTDGKFYLHFPSEPGERPRLYEAESDREVSANELLAQGTPVRWLPSGGAHLLIRREGAGRKLPDDRNQGPPRAVLLPAGPSGDLEYVIYDVGIHRPVKTFKGHFPRWGSPAGVVPYLSGTRVMAIKEP